MEQKEWENLFADIVETQFSIINMWMNIFGFPPAKPKIEARREGNVYYVNWQVTIPTNGHNNS